MKKTLISAIILVATTLLAACGTTDNGGSQGQLVKEPTITQSNNPDIIYVDGVPFSQSFQVKTMQDPRTFKEDETFEYSNYSLGESGEFFNYSLAKPKSWTVAAMQPKIYGIESGKDVLGVILLEEDSDKFINYSNCSNFVKSLYGEEDTLRILKAREVEVHGVKWDRVYYETENENGIDQCYKTEKSIVVLYSLLDKLDSSLKNEEVEKILDDFYFMQLGDY